MLAILADVATRPPAEAIIDNGSILEEISEAESNVLQLLARAGLNIPERPAVKHNHIVSAMNHKVLLYLLHVHE